MFGGYEDNVLQISRADKEGLRMFYDSLSDWSYRLVLHEFCVCEAIVIDCHRKILMYHYGVDVRDRFVQIVLLAYQLGFIFLWATVRLLQGVTLLISMIIYHWTLI